MADIDKRLRYFNGQFLEQKDFRDEQDYHVDRQRRHNRLLHTYGVAEGLEVTGSVGAGQVTVKTGTALDEEGQQIVLTGERTLSLNDFTSQTALVVISYDEIAVDPASVGNQGEMTRTEERPKVELVAEGSAPPAGTHVRLARVTVGAGGSLANPVDDSVRQSAAVRLGEQVTIKSLRLSNKNLAEVDWPTLTAGNAQEIVASGSLHVSEDLVVKGLISGQLDTNVTFDGSQIVAGSISTAKLADNSVTAAKILDGSVGNAELGTNAVTSVKIADLNVTSAKLADLGVTSAKLADNSVTAAKILDGTVGSAELASNAVTTVKITDLNVTGGKIADSTINETKLDGATRAKLTGALPATDYDFGRRSLALANFTNNDADGATRTVNLGFQPRFLWATIGSYFLMAGNYAGPSISGFAELESGIDQRGSYVVTYRYTGAPYWSSYSQDNSGSLARLYLLDHTTNPFSHIDLTVRVTSVTATGLVVTLSRSTASFYQNINNFNVALQLACVG